MHNPVPSGKIKEDAQKGKGGRKRWKTRKTLNAGTMTGRGNEVVDVMERKKIDVLCVQETRWRGQKAKELGNGYKLYYMGEDNRRNGVSVVLSPEMKEGIVQVNRESDRVKDRDKRNNGQRCVCVCTSIGVYRRGKRRILGSAWGRHENIGYGGGLDTEDLNGHAGEGSLDTEVTGKYGVGTWNEGDRIVDFATAKSIAVVNTYLQKRLTRQATYTSGGQNTQVTTSCAGERNYRE
ncbi:craniofacial development protein 2-like [Penaeus monodon]|uniref:craniofacial development protein 2-like n=1 Tax=Penaeus monodon TaxID=6687 RepID=UPI0018A72315|nr:craniofacial development protein 2-like [Penaeus monodon]